MRRSGVKTRFVAHVVLDQSFKHKHDGPTGQILLSTVAGRGEDAKQTHNNQPSKQLDTYLGRVSLKYRGDRAAAALAAAHALRGHFVCVFTWLIVVLHDVIFCCINRNQLKLSRVNRNGIGQPPACAYLVSTPCISGDGGPPWWRGPGITLKAKRSFLFP